MKTAKSFIACVGTALILAACAQSYEPVVDMEGVNPNKYQSDLATCRGYAEKVDAAGNGATDTLLGAGIGAAAGAALGAIGGNAGGGALIGTTIGGLGGGGTGVADSVARQKTIINNCLTKRGYTVLG